MKSHLFTAIRLTGACLGSIGIYTLLVLAVAQIAPNSGKGTTIMHAGKTYYSNIGQSFTQDKYFWSRPSAAGYNASGSAGSNKGPSNPDYLEQVQARIDTFLVHNPGVQISDIPVDLITASGSGLDPHISVEAARIQISRIAKIRSLPETELQQLVSRAAERPLLGLFGPEKVNTLALNIALDQLAQQ